MNLSKILIFILLLNQRILFASEKENDSVIDKMITSQPTKPTNDDILKAITSLKEDQKKFEKKMEEKFRKFEEENNTIKIIDAATEKLTTPKLLGLLAILGLGAYICYKLDKSSKEEKVIPGKKNLRKSKK